MEGFRNRSMSIMSEKNVETHSRAPLILAGPNGTKRVDSQ